MIKKAKGLILKVAEKNKSLRGLLIFTVKRGRDAEFLRWQLKKEPIDEKMVIFEAYGGRSYTGNPKALYLEMLENPKYKDYLKVWAFREPEKYTFLAKNENTVIVKFRSSDYYSNYAKAKYWISNYRLPQEIKKRKGQIFIQTWHGVPLKRLGYDIENYNTMTVKTKQLRREYTEAALMYDYMLSPSKFYTEKLTSAYRLQDIGKENIFIEEGYPRNDYLYKYTEEEALKVKKALGIPEGKKVLLYCPTYRDNQYKLGEGNTYTLGIDFEILKRSLEKEYCILFKAHYLIINQIDLAKYQGFIINVSDYPEINDLYIASDMLITDYSSVTFDYAILKRPIVFYMYDLQEYENNLRGFYFDIKELPGPITKTEEELIEAIRGLSKDFKYDEKYIAFNQKHNYLNGPDSSRRTLDKCIF